MNLSTHPTQSRNIPFPTRDELEMEAHISNEINAASATRTNLRTLADKIENQPSSMRWLKGWDKADLIAQLREWASVDDATVESTARDGFVVEGE